MSLQCLDCYDLKIRSTSDWSRHARVRGTEGESKPALHGISFATVNSIRKCEAKFQILVISQLAPWLALHNIRLAAFSAPLAKVESRIR